MKTALFMLLAFGACSPQNNGGQLDAGALDGSISDAGSIGDSGLVGDAGSVLALAPFGIRLAYFPGAMPVAPSIVDLCFKEQSDTNWTRAYNTPGIEKKQVGRLVNLVKRGTYSVRIIDFMQSCQVPFFETTISIGNDSSVSRPTLLYKNGLSGTAVATTSLRRESPTDLLGKDRLRVDVLLDDGTTALNVSFDQAGTKKPVGSFLDIPEGTLGQIVLDLGVQRPAISVPYRAASTAATSIYLTGNGSTVLFCDDFGPPDGILSRCSSTLRTP